MSEPATAAATSAAPYQVLARRRRPQSFDALIGQEAMVRVLRNAFATGRIAHAFILTGVRGVGKTTTARIIARGLNCEGPDGRREQPTVEPCGVCGPCRAIAEGRFIDVMEIDAASHTGVDFVRDVNEMARTRPTARFKVFILDEVHMLSTSAFNALLKTLEEPPGHVKFIFATTEIRKVPPTVLSRCQRFDLRRIEPERMLAFLTEVAAGEEVEIAPDALGLIVRAAEGSVRDALSLLDQAIAHGGGGAVTAEQTRAMLGLADRGRAIDLFERVMRGEAREALALLGALHRDGADPAAVLSELAEVAHWVSVVKIDASAADDPTVTPAERDGGRALAERLGMRQLSRAWQMLLKALEEVGRAPNPLAAAEMAVIRLTHVAELPSPEEIVRRLTESPGGEGPPGGRSEAPPARPAAAGSSMASSQAPSAAAPAPAGRASAHGSAAVATSAASPQARLAPRAEASPQPAAAPAPERSPDPALARFPDFDAALALIKAKRDMALAFSVESHLKLVSYAPGRIVFEPAPGAPADLAGELTRKLGAWTGARWVVSVVSEGGAPTAEERRREHEAGLRAEAEARPLVRAALSLFPGARIASVRPLRAPEPPSELEPPPPDEAPWPEDGDWTPIDPFDEE